MVIGRRQNEIRPFQVTFFVGLLYESDPSLFCKLLHFRQAVRRDHRKLRRELTEHGNPPVSDFSRPEYKDSLPGKIDKNREKGVVTHTALLSCVKKFTAHLCLFPLVLRVCVLNAAKHTQFQSVRPRRMSQLIDIGCDQ